MYQTSISSQFSLGETTTPVSGPRPVRVRFFKFYRAPCVRSASGPCPLPFSPGGLVRASGWRQDVFSGCDPENTGNKNAGNHVRCGQEWHAEDRGTPASQEAPGCMTTVTHEDLPPAAACHEARPPAQQWYPPL
eukprot:gene24691-biopygen19443